MPSKTEFYRQMADHVATQLTGSWQEWAGFLTTAARLYKYPFHEQLLIYAQRPDATACAEYDLWNEKMGRYVRRGSKGIALVDDSGDRPRLRYVFDVSDTGIREHSRTPWLWKMEEAYQEPVSAMLEHTYEVGGDNLAQQLEAVAHKLAGEYWNEHRQDLLYIVDDSFLEEYDEFNIEAQFKAAATVSISYALMSRCGLEPERYFTHEDFMAIFDFNTPATIGALGTAVSQINQQVLRQIGVTIRNYEREQLAERSKHHEESHELHPERRLPDSRPEAERAAGEAPGQVRQDAEIIPEGTPSHAIRAWNGDIQSKHAVVRYMEKHGREKDTAAWLAQEYSGSDSKSLFVIRAGSPEGIELPWPKVQRRIAQLIKEDRFYTEAEQDRFDNIDPIAIREALAERGIVNDELVDEEKLDNDPFIQRVMADVEQIAAEEQEQSNQPLSDAEYARHNLIPGETTFALDGRTFRVSKLEPDVGRVELQDVTFANAVGFPIFRVEPISVIRQHLEQEPEPPTPATEPEKTLNEVLDEHPVSIQVNGEWQTFPNVKAAEEASYEEYKANLRRTTENFLITDDHLGEGGPKAKFQANITAIKLLKYLEETTGQATPEQQKILSRYVGWGGLADAFDPEKPAWAAEYAQLKELLTRSEYAAARGSTLNAHYTSPTVIKAIYEAVGRMGFETGNILEPSCGVGNFFGMLPEKLRNSRLYGVELDSISGRIAKQLYPKADITVAGFETTDRRDFYDLAVGNVPFGQYQVRDKAYDKLNFSIHNYFFAKALDQVRPGGVVAFVTSRYTMDTKDSTVRRYLAQRAELLGAIRLPNDAFKKNAGAEVVSDIIFLQKRDRPLDIVPEWTQTGQTQDGFAINRYFLDHPEMVLGRQEPESTAHGMDYTVNPIEGLELADQLHDAVKYIHGTYQEAELPELGEGEAIDTSIPADPNVKNYSYTVVDGAVYFRENSRMVRPDLNATAEVRVKGLVGLRECVQQLIDLQMDAATPDSAIRDKQAELNRLYDSFSAKYGLINDRANRLVFADDSSYYLLCALEVIDEDGKLERKADMFTKCTIKPHKAVETVDTASEALAVSIAEKACVDMAYMSELTGKTSDELAAELQGVIFRVPGQLEKDGTPHYVTADEYLSGNVRRKLRQAQRAAQQDPSFAANVEALTAAQPKDLDASEIEVRLGATWIDKEYIQQFMYETFDTPFYMQRNIQVNYTPFTAEWQITGKSSVSQNNVAAYTTYGTSRANAYKILEDSLNLRDVRIYDTVEDADGKLHFRSLMNDYHLKDLSGKIKSVLYAKKKSGQYLTAYAPYGYRKSDEDKHRLVVDEEAAAVVREIYQMRCSGMAYGKIAAALNEKSILSPRWHWELHYGKKGSCKYSKLWTYATVKNILNDTVYLGIVTQNRTGSRSYKDKTMIQKPETEWICHEDAHEAIVDRKLWETVQEKNRAVKQRVASHAAPLPALFTGKLVCADCGHPLAATRETQRRKNGTSKRYVSYICSHFATTGRSACSWHRIYEISLKTLVLNEIRAHSRAVAQDENAVLDKLKQQILSESAARQEDSRLEISRLRRRIGELEHMTAKLYEDKVSGIINNDTFAVLIQESEQERIQKAERLEVLLAEERKAQQEVENIRQWAGIIRRYLDMQELDREIVEELIDHIEVGERSVIDGQRQQDVKIFYRFVGVV